MEPNKPNKILTVVLDNLGDAVMATSILKPLKQWAPASHIGFWVKDYAAGIFEDHSMIDKVHAADPFWDTAPGLPKGDWDSFKKAWKEVKEEKYDVALVLNSEWRRSLACFLAGIPTRVGYKKRKSGFFLNHAIPLPKPRRSPIEEHRYLVESWLGQTFSNDLWVPRLDSSEREKTLGQNWIKDLGWQRNPIVVFHPFAGDVLKCWPVNRWGELVKSLGDRNKKLRFACVCTKKEKRKLEKEFSLISQEKCQLVTPTFSELKAILQNAALFIGGDSGPGHIAAALGKPVLSLFGPTNPKMYAPRGQASIMVLKRDKMDQLSVADIFKATEGLLS